MKIAFTYNLQLRSGEDEAEFDRPETIAALTQAMARLGHEVEQVEVSGPASRLVANLEALKPDLIFNTAEGRGGRFREAFYPGLFEQLAIPYTGSDAYVCAITLDKQLSKLAIAARGVPTPRWLFVEDMRDWKTPELRFPVIVKPNFEGSSKGITQASVIERVADLEPAVAGALAQYPAGVLVEEFIDGSDLVVPFLERASPKTGGVLAPFEYVFNEAVTGSRKYNIYDFALKHGTPNAVSIRFPTHLSKTTQEDTLRHSRTIFKALGIRDLGRIDFRLTPDGRLYFLEANALPSLEPGAGLYASASQAGLVNTDAVVDAVIRSAAERHGLRLVTGRGARKRPGLRVGLTFNLKRIVPKADGGDDREAEYDAPTTIAAIREAIASYGHEVIDLEATQELPSLLPAADVDLVFNVAEGLRGRNREGQVPSILELLDIPYTGSDPAALSITLDKALAKRIVRQAGISSPNYFLLATGKERFPKELRFPVIVKPAAEGSSKGVKITSVARTENEARDIARDIIQKYDQPALAEEFLSGREFTVALLGERRPKVLPPMEIVFQRQDDPFPVYSFEHKLNWSNDIRYDAPAQLTPQLARDIERAARGAFAALGCRDVARIDLRLDATGRVNFIECNPLPGLTPDWSDLCLIAKSAGMDYRTLIGEIMAPALRRYRERERARRIERGERLVQGGGNGAAHHAG